MSRSSGACTLGASMHTSVGGRGPRRPRNLSRTPFSWPGAGGPKFHRTTYRGCWEWRECCVASTYESRRLDATRARLANGQQFLTPARVPIRVEICCQHYGGFALPTGRSSSSRRGKTCRLLTARRFFIARSRPTKSGSIAPVGAFAVNSNTRPPIRPPPERSRYDRSSG